MKLLSILIPTMPRRAQMLARLRRVLDPQLTDEVEVVIENDDGSMPIGHKRNLLLERAAGDYVAFVDDDDAVSSDYVAKIVEALKQGPDVVGICGVMTVDGAPGTARRFVHSLQYQNWEERNGVFIRPPNHLNPVATPLARRTGFKPISFGEDRDYSDRLRPTLRTEVMISSVLYLYAFRRNKNGI